MIDSLFISFLLLFALILINFSLRFYFSQLTFWCFLLSLLWSLNFKVDLIYYFILNLFGLPFFLSKFFSFFKLR